MKVLISDTTTSEELSLCLGQLFTKEIAKHSMDSVHGLFDPVSGIVILLIVVHFLYGIVLNFLTC